MYLLRYTFSILLGLLGFLFIFMNWFASILYYKKGSAYYQKKFSHIMIFGGVFLCFAIILMPNNPYIWLWWVPLVVDIGCLPSIIAIIIKIIKEKK